MIVHYHAPRSPDTRDPFLPLKALGEIFHVRPTRLRDLQKLGLIEFEVGRIGRFDAYFARASQLLDIPFLRASEIAQICEVAVTTVHRARRSGKLWMVRPPGCRQYRATPRDVITYKRHLDLRRGKLRLPTMAQVADRNRSRRTDAR